MGRPPRRRLGALLLIRFRSSWWIGPLLAALFVWAGVASGMLEGVDEDYVSFLSAHGRPAADSIPIAIVDISDEFVHEMEEFPFPRTVYARLLDRLEQAGARWVVFDLVLDAPQKAYPEADRALAAALARHPRTTLSGQIQQGGATAAGGAVEMVYRQADDWVRPLDRFLAANSRWGVVQAQEDVGTAIRYRAWWSDESGERRLSLGVRALVDAGLVDSARMLSEPPYGSEDGFRIRYLGPARTFPYVSMGMLIDDSGWTSASEKEWGEQLNLGDSIIASGILRDRIVLVGPSALLMHDLVRIPGENEPMPGVEMHAHAMATILARSALRDLTLKPWGWALALFGALVLISAAARRSPWWSLPLLGSALLVGWAGLCAWAAIGRQLVVPVSPGLYAAIGMTVVASLERYIQEARKKREITGMFGKYVAPEVVRMMVADPSLVQLGGQRGEVTVLFSDFQGFTQLSEALPPERFVGRLGECFTELTRCIHDEKGILDKYMGDAIMAEFGIPVAFPDKALRACRAAWAMQSQLALMRAEWTAQGWPELRMRIGIATGDAIYGNLGSRQLFDYTAIGDAINLGSRLEGANKTYGTSIAIDRSTRIQAGDAILARLLDRVRVVGKNQAVEVYELVGIRGEPGALLDEESLELWARVRELSVAGRFDRALADASDFLRRHPADQPGKLLLERLRRTMDGGGAEWVDEVALTSK